MSETFDKDLLRRAAEARTGNDFLDGLQMQSLRAVAAKDPAQSAYLESIMAPNEAKLDLHLTGDSVKGHRTRATDLAGFVTHLTRAISHTARELSGRTRWPNDWQIEGLQPGSVRVILLAPPSTRNALDTPAIDGVPEDTYDSQAARIIGETLTAASRDAEPRSDNELVEPLPPGARHQLRLAMQTVNQAGWTVSGDLVQQGHPSAAISLTHRGAEHLVEALRGSDERSEEKTVHGVMDGLRHSTGRVYVVPDHGSPLSFACDDAALLAQVGALSVEPHTRVKATYQETHQLDATGEPLPSPARVLRAISRAEGSSSSAGDNSPPPRGGSSSRFHVDDADAMDEAAAPEP